MKFITNTWRNEKSREIVIQIFVLLCIGWLLSWLVMNVNANFKARCNMKVQLKFAYGDIKTRKK